MSTYRSRTRDERVADEYHAEHGKCTKCGAWTPLETLANLGAQCSGCFGAYCAELNTGRRIPRTAKERRELFTGLGLAMQRNPGARETVATLRAREQAGGQMGPPQLWLLKCCEDKLSGRVFGSTEPA